MSRVNPDRNVRSEKVHGSEKVVEAFQNFDKNNEGYISVDEFCYILQGFGKPLSNEDLNFLVKEIGAKDGKVYYRELIELWDDL